MKAEAELARKAEASYFVHDYLDDFNEPLYFHEFVRRAEANGLQYLWEAQPHITALEQFPPAVSASLASFARDGIEAEQLIDVLRKRTLREALLCRAGVAIDRAIDPGRMRGLYAASNLRRRASPGA